MGYISGYYFNIGYLKGYGIDADLFKLSTYEVYLSTYNLLIHITVSLIEIFLKCIIFLQNPSNFKIIIMILMIVVLVIYIYIKILKIKNKFHNPIKLVFLKKVLSYLDSKNNDFTKAVGITGIFSYIISSIFFFLMNVGFISVLLGVLSMKGGEYYSSKSVEKFIEDGCYVEKGKVWSNCKILKSKKGDKIYEGILVIYSNNNIAFFNKNGSFITKFSDGYSIENKYEKVKNS